MSLAARREPGLAPALHQALAQRFGDAFTVSQAVRLQHGTDEFRHRPVPPDAVVFAASEPDVVDAVRLCAAHSTPLIPYGTGTSVEGHILALDGGVSLDLQRMSRVLRVSPEDMDVTVEPGVTRKALNAHVRDLGLFFPIDPGADASLGGMAATRASGTNAVRYGTMRENVLGLKAVLADGRTIACGGRARKSSAGYDLTRLFVGSEGTLGVITELTLRLQPIPERMSAAVCAFPDIESAVDTAIAAIQSAIPVARMELMDAISIGAVNGYAKLDLPVSPTLFLEFHGSAASVEEQARSFGEIAAAEGGTAFRWSASTEERTALWQARHDAYYGMLALRPGCRGWGTDVCVPISRLAACIEETRADLAKLPFPCPVFGHVGDGNFHVVFIVNLEDAEEMALTEAANERLIARALAMQGTCTGEHGIGAGKIRHLVAEHGEGVAVMKAIKALLDPRGIMNPGKVVSPFSLSPLAGRGPG